MFLPIGDTPNPRGTPWVNYLLIGANVAVFLFFSLPLMGAPPNLNDPLLYELLKAYGVRGSMTAQAVASQLSAYDLAVFRYGFRPADPSLFTLFSSMFMHGGWMHLIGNMLFLWIFGDNVEHRLGHLRYLLAYLVTGAAATLFFTLFVLGSQIPLVGASGAISGVLGLYFIWFPRNQVKTFIFLFPFIMQTFLIPARLVLGFYLVIDNLLPFLINSGSGSGVAHGAHIGGFLAGLGIAWGGDRLRDGLRVKRPRPSVDPGPDPDPEPEPRTLDLPQRISLAVELGAGAWDDALSLFRRFIAERPADSEIGQAYLGAGKALLHKPRCTTSAYHYLLGALDAARDPALIEEVREQIRLVEQLGKK